MTEPLPEPNQNRARPSSNWTVLQHEDAVLPMGRLIRIAGQRQKTIRLRHGNWRRRGLPPPASTKGGSKVEEVDRQLLAGAPAGLESVPRRNAQ